VLARNNKTKTGLAVPHSVASKVRNWEHETRTTRKAAVAAKDARDITLAEESLFKLFPNFPREKAEAMLSHAFRKFSGRVGRTGKLELEEKVKLAVRAHARHLCTNYDVLLNSGMDREEARERVWNDIVKAEAGWKGPKPTAAKPATKPGPKTTPKPSPQRKVTISLVSSDDDEGEESVPAVAENRKRVHFSPMRTYYVIESSPEEDDSSSSSYSRKPLISERHPNGFRAPTLFPNSPLAKSFNSPVRRHRHRKDMKKQWKGRMQ
jgi:hypothetical protein